jgi:hypothetical protein
VAAAAAHSIDAPSSARRISSTVLPATSRPTASRFAITAPPRRLREGRERRIDRDVAAQRVGQVGEAVRAHVMRRDAGATASEVFSRSPGERDPGADLVRHARQNPGAADFGKEPDPDFRHRELRNVARRRDAIRAPTRRIRRHHDAVDQRRRTACVSA